jgi:zinc and cadmium transporter
MLLGWIIGFSVIASVGAVLGAASILLFPETVRRTIVSCLLSYATGTLLGAAFLGMLPAALREGDPGHVMMTVLVGVVLFFVLEKLVIWRHCHEEDCRVHGQAAPLILIGDGFHNLVDGVVVAAAFLTDTSLGIATAVAVVAHELPQELGDFAILLDAGCAPKRALVLNAMSSATTLPGALAAYFWLGETQNATPYVLSLAAASFIYIATADLIPDLHRRSTPASSLRQLVLLALGIATVVAFQR